MSLSSFNTSATSYMSVPSSVQPTFVGDSPTKQPVRSEHSIMPRNTPLSQEHLRNSEIVECYGKGTRADRRWMIGAVDDFCDKWRGITLDGYDQSRPPTVSQDFSGGPSGSMEMTTIHVSVTVINNCIFDIDGGSLQNECGRILRRAVDECNTSSENNKQGGIVTSDCARWSIDPNRLKF